MQQFSKNTPAHDAAQVINGVLPATEAQHDALAAAIWQREQEALADRGFDVHLTTSDPAAHLSSTLNGNLKNLQVSRINPHDETERYRQHVLEMKGRDLDEAGRRFVVMDTAPTGHTLLLLDATGAYHREIAKKMGDKGHFTTPMMQLQDPDRTNVLLVTLPETTPVLEAANLQADLERAGIHPWGWIINNCLSIADTRSPLLCQRARQEQPQIEAVKHQHASRIALVPVLASEPAGIEKLRA